MLGIVTPTKTDSKSWQDESNGSPEYKLGGASVLDASEDKFARQSTNDMIAALGKHFQETNKGIKLHIDTSPERAVRALQRLNNCLAQSVPDGPAFAAYMNNTIPLDPTYVPASAVVELGRGKLPQCLAVQEQLATVDGSATGGTGNDYLNNLRFRLVLITNLN